MFPAAAMPARTGRGKCSQLPPSSSLVSDAANVPSCRHPQLWMWTRAPGSTTVELTTQTTTQSTTQTTTQRTTQRNAYSHRGLEHGYDTANDTDYDTEYDTRYDTATFLIKTIKKAKTACAPSNVRVYTRVYARMRLRKCARASPFHLRSQATPLQHPGQMASVQASEKKWLKSLEMSGEMTTFAGEIRK